jgi:aryl-alcohol dehydrogenase-like predicted oxidoreductase
MIHRDLGRTPLTLSAIGFGCGKLAATLGRNGEAEATNTILEALDRGVNFFDTADIYGQGRSEQILGASFRARRQSVVIATKAGYRLGAAGGLGAKLKPLLRPVVRRLAWFRRSLQHAAAQQRQQDFSPAYLLSAIEASLRRLQTDYIDIFLLHSPDREVIAGAEWVEVLELARTQGKIRCYGVSCRTAADGAECMRRIPGVACVQIPVNLIETDDVDSTLKTAAELGVGVLARQPLASGLLAKPMAELKPDDFPWDRSEFAARIQRVQSIAGSRDTADQCVESALRYVLGLRGISSVVLGMSSRKHLAQNLRAVEAGAPARSHAV